MRLFGSHATVLNASMFVAAGSAVSWHRPSARTLTWMGGVIQSQPISRPFGLFVLMPHRPCFLGPRRTRASINIRHHLRCCTLSFVAVLCMFVCLFYLTYDALFSGRTDPCRGDWRRWPDCILPAVQHRQGRCLRQRSSKTATARPTTVVLFTHTTSTRTGVHKRMVHAFVCLVNLVWPRFTD